MASAAAAVACADERLLHTLPGGGGLAFAMDLPDLARQFEAGEQFGVGRITAGRGGRHALRLVGGVQLRPLPRHLVASLLLGVAADRGIIRLGCIPGRLPATWVAVEMWH